MGKPEEPPKKDDAETNDPDEPVDEKEEE